MQMWIDRPFENQLKVESRERESQKRFPVAFSCNARSVLAYRKKRSCELQKAFLRIAKKRSCELQKVSRWPAISAMHAVTGVSRFRFVVRHRASGDRFYFSPSVDWMRLSIRTSSFS